MHFRHRLLEIDVPTVGAEPADEQSVQQGANLFMAGSSGKYPDWCVLFLQGQHRLRLDTKPPYSIFKLVRTLQTSRGGPYPCIAKPGSNAGSTATVRPAPRKLS